MHTNSEQERAAVLQAAVGIANEVGYSNENKLDACHEVARRVIGIFDTQFVILDPVVAEAIDNVVPITRRGAEDPKLVSDYDIMRLRCAASAEAMFGESKAA